MEISHPTVDTGASRTVSFHCVPVRTGTVPVRTPNPVPCQGPDDGSLAVGHTEFEVTFAPVARIGLAVALVEQCRPNLRSVVQSRRRPVDLRGGHLLCGHDYDSDLRKAYPAGWRVVRS